MLKILKIHESKPWRAKNSGRLYYKRMADYECPLCKRIYTGILNNHQMKVKQCLQCSNDARIGRALTRTDKIGDLSQGFYSRIKNCAVYRNHDFKVSKKYLWDIFVFQDKKCALSGIDIHMDPLHRSKTPTKSTYTDYRRTTASLDRIDSSKGYLKGNVQWVHKLVNVMKSNMCDDDFIYLCRKVNDFNRHKDNTEPTFTHESYFSRRKKGATTNS